MVNLPALVLFKQNPGANLNFGLSAVVALYGNHQSGLVTSPLLYHFILIGIIGHQNTSLSMSTTRLAHCLAISGPNRADGCC